MNGKIEREAWNTADREVKKVAPRIRSWCSSRGLRCKQSQDDLIADVMFRVARALESESQRKSYAMNNTAKISSRELTDKLTDKRSEPRSSHHNLVWQCANQELVDQFRKTRRERQCLDESFARRKIPMFEETSVTTGILEGLRDDEAEIIRRRFFNSETVSELAKDFAVHNGTMSRRINLILRKLRSMTESR